MARKKDSNVEPLFEVETRTPNEGLIEQLEHLLEEARSGELITMVYACRWHARSWSRGWCFPPGAPNGSDMVGEIECLKHELMAAGTGIWIADYYFDSGGYRV